MDDEIDELVEYMTKQRELEQEHIKTLIQLRDELKDGCECGILSEEDKKQWYKEVAALQWAFLELGIGGK